MWSPPDPVRQDLGELALPSGPAANRTAVRSWNPVLTEAHTLSRPRIASRKVSAWAPAGNTWVAETIANKLAKVPPRVGADARGADWDKQRDLRFQPRPSSVRSAFGRP